MLRGQLRLDEVEFAGVAAFRHQVSTILPSYLDNRRRDENIRDVTLAEIILIFDTHLLPFFGKKKLAQITPVLWHQYCATKDIDLANHRKVMRGFLKWCVDKGFLAGVPDISRIPKHHRRRRRVIRADELHAIFTHASGSLKLFLALALHNGLRRKEIITLRWDGIDTDRRFLTIEKKHNKKNRARTIPINQVIRKLLIDRRTEQKNKGQWVFPNAKDKGFHADVSGLKTAWRTCLTRAKLEDITWHDFRATYETWANKSTAHTDTQKEKFADSSMDVQKTTYVNMNHEDLAGLEDAVQIPGLDALLIHDSGRTRGDDQ